MHSSIQNYYIFFLVFLSFCTNSHQLDCSQISENDEIAGKVWNIPINSTDPVTLPSNFNCTYKIKPASLVYAQITVTNGLKGVNDVIYVSDSQQKTDKLDRNSPTSKIFYVFPQTETTVNIQNFDATSKIQIKVVYTALEKPQQRALQKGQNLNYLTLTSVQKKPLCLSGDGPISLTLARSGYIVDKFDNYFVIDGDLSNPRTIRRLVDFQTSSFNTSSNLITIVGLDDDVSHSSFILNPSSQLVGFSKFAGVSVDGITGNVAVHAVNEQKVAVIIVAKDSQQLVLNGMKLGEGENCKAVAVTGPPTADSKTLIDFKSDDYSLPQLFPYPYFSIIVENCDISFNLKSTLSNDYYIVDGDRNGFIFSPIYFNSEATNGYMNITFEYSGEEKKQFSVDVDRVILNSANSELDINIYDRDLKKTLSTVITGNQEGTRSRAFGSLLNVQMSGSTSARLHWSLSSGSHSLFNVIFIILISALTTLISF